MEVNVERLKALRSEHVMTLRELADEAGVSKDTIWRLENGHSGAYPSTIRKLAAGLEVRPQMLMGGVEYLEEGHESEQMENKLWEEPGRDRKVGF